MKLLNRNLNRTISTKYTQISQAASPIDDRMTSSPSSQQIDKPYKPKFHNASLYTKDETKSELISLQQQQKQQHQHQQETPTSTRSVSTTVTASSPANNVHPLVKKN